MMGTRTLWVLLLVAVCVGCGAADEGPEWAPPTSARATLVLEPPVLVVGEVARLDLAIVTPPGQIVRPPQGPESTAGLAILERSPVETRREPSRWVHTVTMRARALGVGPFEIDGGRVEIETEAGAVEPLAVPPLAGEVVSVLAEHAAQGSPYGVRRLPLAGPAGVGVVGAFVAGAGLALASVAFLVLLRRRSRTEAKLPSASGEPMPSASEDARQALAGARERAEASPRRALDEAARVLRCYADARFGAAIGARTVEELDGAAVPFLLTTRWPSLLELLRALDGARFPETVDAAGVRSLLDRAIAFVDDSAPADPS